jgi:hypoxanthine-DNA glycosylase
MSEILRTRIISPLTRKATSVSYKINTESVSKNDTLRVEISHALKPEKWVYIFKGSQIAGKKSIHFSVTETNGKISISWGALDCREISKQSLKRTGDKDAAPKVFAKKNTESSLSINKKSFLPVVDKETRVLILGSLPGDESLKKQQYYAKPSNQFWKIISVVIDQQLPSSYEDRITLLMKHNIGIWDVCHSANRKGSLDQDIKDEIPNDITGLLKKYPLVKTVLFNGAKAKVTFDKHFVQNPKVFYGTLVSSSGAATISLSKKTMLWKSLILKQKEVGDE